MQPLLVQLWAALRRRAGRLERLAPEHQAGRLPAGPIRKRPPLRWVGAGQPRLPGGFAWLVRLAPETACYGSQLQAVLSEPEMAGLLQAAPQAGRLIRPLCRMLGVRPGPGLAPALVLPRREPVPPPARPDPARPPDLRLRPRPPRVRPPRARPAVLVPSRNATAPPARRRNAAP